jgi:phage tail sheath protein FI
MPITTTYPGVYIQEIPSGVRTIIGVSTSVTAFVGYFRRGPLDTPIQVFNMGDFDREFGGLHPDDETGYSIQQFFLNGGGNAWVVRVASGATLAATTTMETPVGAAAVTASTGREVRGVSRIDPGVWGDFVRIQVDYDTGTVPNAVGDLYNMRISEVSTVDGRRVVERFETYANLSTSSLDVGYAIGKVNESSKLVQLTEVAAQRPAQTGTTGGPIAGGPNFDNGDTLNVDVGGGARLVTLTGLPGPSNFGGASRLIARALERALQASGRAANPQIAALSGASVRVQGDHIRVLAGGDDPNVIVSFADFGGTTATDLGLTGGAEVENVQEYSLGPPVGAGIGLQSLQAGGNDGALPDADALIGDFGDKSGFHALRDVDIFNILCIPRAAALGDDVASASVYAAAETFCENERAFLIVDLPEAVDEGQEAIDWVDDANIRHKNAAVYFPRIRIPDREQDGRLRNVAPSGTMAGIYARTDGERGVWKAPAGLAAVLRNVQGLPTQLTDPENGQINPMGINGLRRFPIYGRVAWGARTLVGADAQASEWKYIPVRRLALFLEESLYRGLQWVVFEPNDEPLWSQIRLNAGAFMHDLFRRGAFQGTSPRDAYFVKCDSETTTQNDINAGIVNVVIGFAPLKPAEFVIISIQQIAGEINT